MTIKIPDTTRAMRAARAAGIEHFDVLFDYEGKPIIRVRPGPANDAIDVDAELAAWERDQSHDDAA